MIDVRKPFELESVGKIEGALNIELSFLEEEIKKNINLLPKNGDLYLFCRSGLRSVVAISILEKYGYFNTVNILGGFTDILKFNIP
jgi:rhodanese-related sulfurtransferase